MASSSLPKNLVTGSFVVAALVAAAALLDMIIAIPFAGQMTFDILFLVGAAIVGYLAYDAYKDMA